MEKFITATGKTIDLAIAAALEELHMDRDSVSVEVLENPRSGFLGIGAQPARVKVTYEAPDEAPKPALSSASRSRPKKPAESKPADGAKVIAPAAPKVIAPAAPEAPRPQDTDGALPIKTSDHQFADSVALTLPWDMVSWMSFHTICKWLNSSSDMPSGRFSSHSPTASTRYS